jgi:toxin ParE1/3/4
MKQRRYREEVPDDLADAVAWYQDRQPGLGLRFLELVEETLARIEENPRQFGVLYRDLRRALLPRPFPYQIFFRVHGEFVDIYAIVHTARHPHEWRRRI